MSGFTCTASSLRSAANLELFAFHSLSPIDVTRSRIATSRASGEILHYSIQHSTYYIRAKRAMRTSRIASETAKLVSARSPRSTRERRSFGRSRVSNGLVEDEDDKFESGLEASNPRETAFAASPTLKRKRGESRTGSPHVTRVKEESVSTTTSPRKVDVRNIAPPRKARRQPAKRVVQGDGSVKIEPPPNWEEIYKITQEMRKQWLAPVDTMGCENLAEDSRPPKDRRLQTLVALMLSSQTKDTVTSVAMKNLQEGLPGGFTLESLLAVDATTLNGFINKVGFHNNKTKFIKQMAEILRDNYKSDIPDTIEGLIGLPGVGPKMAYLCMSAAWGKDEGIGVDTHVHRISNLWGWHKTSTPEETRAALESWLPRDKWHDINHLLVGFGQTWCPPVGRKCGECKLAENGLCPSAVVARQVTKRVKKEEIAVKEEDEELIVKKEAGLEMDIKLVKAEDIGPEADESMANLSGDMEDIGVRRRSQRLAS